MLVKSVLFNGIPSLCFDLLEHAFLHRSQSFSFSVLVENDITILFDEEAVGE